MFNPSPTQVRQFFTEAWRKHRERLALTPLEAMAVDWALQHPEYHPDLENPHAPDADYSVQSGRVNPFLHLAMHLAITEQLSIDQPPGIRAAYQRLSAALIRQLGQEHYKLGRLADIPEGEARIDSA